jgi:hypothetical protein
MLPEKRLVEKKKLEDKEGGLDMEVVACPW